MRASSPRRKPGAIAPRRKAQFANADPFVASPDELKAFLEEQANLSQQKFQSLKTIIAGAEDYTNVKKALQILGAQEERKSGGSNL